MASKYQALTFEIADRIGHVVLNRPDKLNALDSVMLRELDAVRQEVEQSDVGAVVFRGAGRCFSAGADLAELARFDTADKPLDHIEWIQRLYNAIEDLNIPTIAAIHGFAFGGGLELALCCDLRILADDGRVGVPEIKVGLLPGAGGTQRLSATLPPAVARRMILLGDPLTAQEALTHGLVNGLYPADQVLEAALGFARRFLEMPPLAVRVGKMLIRGASQPLVRTGIEAERQGMAFLFATEDRKEGTTAFVEKRSPTFRGR